MAPDTTVQLGEFSFAGFEVPENIRFGGSQRISVKELVGGKRVLDCMGRSDRPLEWSGIFTGGGAADRARALDAIRVGGLKQTLTWGFSNYDVVVREFEADYQRFYRIPYRIVCEVVTDNLQPLVGIPPAPIDDALQDDFNQAKGLGGIIGDDHLNTLLGGLDTAISGVSSFANAAQSTINSVLMPLGAVAKKVSTLIGASTLTLQNVSTFGGALPSTPFSQAPGKLVSQMNAMTQSNNLFCLRNVLGRMNANLVSINTPQKQISTAGGNLFQIAQSQYGDANAWTALAQANGVTDPFIKGTATIAVPLRPGRTGGILNA
jgi:hypothetical protein